MVDQRSRPLLADPLPPSSARHGGPRSEHRQLDDYPELELVLSIAIAAVVPAFGVDVNDGAAMEELEQAAIGAMVDAYAPMASTARLMAGAAERARRVHAATVAETAAQLADQSVQTAAALQLRDEASAGQVAAEASAVARQVAESVVRGTETASAAAAALVTLEVRDAAAITAAERAHAARIVARSVSLAVSEAAAASEAAALAAELEVLNAALTVEAIAFDTCYRLAVDAAAAVAAGAAEVAGRSAAGG